MVKSNKTTISSKKHDDRELAAKTSFESTSVEIQSPRTMILLLASKEDMVILKTLSTLDKYASKLEQNAQVLFEEGVLKLLFPLITHTELFIKRFALKLLSELCFLPPVVEELLQEEVVQTIMGILDGYEDYVVKEFSSSILAELTRSRVGCNYLLKSNLVHILNLHLSKPDPDIQKNCLQIIFNLIEDPYNHTLLTTDDNFSMKALLDLLMSDYVAIQHLALDTLNIVTQWRKENPVSKEFQSAGGVAIILSILKNYEWKDIHGKCFDVLGNIYDDPNIAQNFLKDGVLRLFSYIDLINDPSLRKKAAEVITKITATPLGRKVLTESGHVPQLVSMLLEQSVGLSEAASHSVAGLAHDYTALQEILAHETVSDLLSVMTDQARDWDTRAAATNALYQILKRDNGACSSVIDSDHQDVFETIINQFGKGVPTEAAINAANCITVLAGYNEFRSRIISQRLISSLLHCFQDGSEDRTVLKLAACEALCSLLSEEETRHLLRVLAGLPTVWTCLSSKPRNTALLQSAATFVHLCVTNDSGFTAELMRLGVINWLLTHKSIRNECPAWEMALETIYNKFLPIKFAMTGRLELTDVTENSFYITKTPLTREQLDKNQFPILPNLIANNTCPIQTLYVANFVEDYSSILKKSIASRSEQSRGDGSEAEGSAASLPFSYNSDTLLHVDLHLLNYIDSLKNILKQNGYRSEESNKNNSVVDGDTVRGKALLIGQFVANQMSGVDKTEKCSAHSLDLHINELKVEIMNSILPIGWLRTGLHLERAVLFKVLADRVGLPAGLVRGQRTWVEVAIPILPQIPCPAYPSHLLRPNHVVDLITAPGQLHPLGSFQADVYCGKL